MIRASISRIVILCAISLVLLNSCEPDNNSEIIFRDDYLGIWDANETEGNLAPQFYVVTIAAGPGQDELYISGLYNTPGTEVLVTVNGPTFVIPSQSTSGITFSGSGLSDNQLTSISLNFIANDGTGNDQVRAVLTR